MIRNKPIDQLSVPELKGLIEDKYGIKAEASMDVLRHVEDEEATPTLEQLRTECNLTYQALADETGTLDEKTVRGHCHGKPMRQATRKIYLQVFSRLLKRDLKNIETPA